MKKKWLLAMMATVLITRTGDAQASCADMLSCVCKGYVNGAMLIGTVKAAPDQDGRATITLDRVEVPPDARATSLKVGDAVSIASLPSGTAAGARILATSPSDTNLWFIKTLDGSNSSCSGATFTEKEVVEMNFAGNTACRERAQQRIEVEPCNDNVSCSVGTTAPSSSDPVHGWTMGLAITGLVVALRRRFSRR